MANNKDPAVLFYTSDFLSGCALMDMRERGQYITLLCLQRERGHMTMQEIIRAVKKPSDEVMSKFRRMRTASTLTAGWSLKSKNGTSIASVKGRTSASVGTKKMITLVWRMVVLAVIPRYYL